MIKYKLLKEIVSHQKNLFKEFDLPFRVFAQYLLKKKPDLQVPSLKDKEGHYHFVVSGEISGNLEAPYFWLFSKNPEMAKPLISYVLERCGHGILYFDQLLEKSLKNASLKEIHFEKDFLYQGTKDVQEAQGKIILFKNGQKDLNISPGLLENFPPMELWDRMDNKYAGSEVENKVTSFLDITVEAENSVFLQNLFVEKDFNHKEEGGKLVRLLSKKFKNEGKRVFALWPSKDDEFKELLLNGGMTIQGQLDLFSWQN